jgi:hypothetical protein
MSTDGHGPPQCSDVLVAPREKIVDNRYYEIATEPSLWLEHLSNSGSNGKEIFGDWWK